MKRVNLLPPEMASRLVRLQQRRLRIAALGIGVVAISAWVGLATTQYLELETKILLAEHKLTLRQTDGHAAGILDAEGTRLWEFVETANQLQDRVSPPSVLALMTHLAPESIRFDNLLITRIPTAKHGRTPGMTGIALERCANVQVDGTAETDAAIVEFVRILSDSPFLQNVRAQQTRKIHHEGEGMAGFSITMDIVSSTLEYAKAELP